MYLTGKALVGINDNIIIALHSVFKQVMFAIGRDPCTQGIGLENAGVKLNPK